MPVWSFKTNKNMEDEGVVFDIPRGSYEINDILLLTQQYFDYYNLPVNIALDDKKNRVILKIRKKSVVKEDRYTLFFNSYMNKILGFTLKTEPKRYDLTRKWHTIEAPYAPNIHAYTPKSIIMTCDIVGDTIFGGERLKLLRLITNKMERLGDTMHYDFLHDEYIDLRTHEFERITIRLSDVTGNILKVDYNEIATRLQLEFQQRKST